MCVCVVVIAFLLMFCVLWKRDDNEYWIESRGREKENKDAVDDFFNSWGILPFYTRDENRQSHNVD